MSGDPFGSWPRVARFYLIGVAVLGAAVTGYALSQTDGSHTVVFAALLCLSLVGSIGRVVLPIPGHGTSLALSALVDYIALIACGPSAAVLVAAWSGWTGSALGSERKPPVHGVVFNVASAALAMSVAGVMFAVIDRQPPLWNNGPRVEAFAAGATVFFLLHSRLVAIAGALSMGQSIAPVWLESFFENWPSHSIGAALAAAIGVILDRRAYWLVPLLAGPLVLVHRSVMSYLDRLNEAVTDPMTLLPNQRYLMAHMERALTRARHDGRPVAVIFLDLNDFKAVNDNAGHAAGDAALRLVASRLKSVVRANDLCARYAGDEFVVVLDNCPKAEALLRAEEMQAAVHSLIVDGQTGFRMSLSVSAGVAVYPDDGDTAERLFFIADRRMYQRKSTDTGIHRLAAL